MNSSLDAYVMALETINRLSLEYRVEGFCFLVVNAWELLLKAQIVDQEGVDKIYYPKKRGEERRSLSLDSCIFRVFPNENDPIRSNLLKVAEFRNKAVHLVIGRVPKDVLALFQANILNYHGKLSEWFGVSLSERVPVGMMTIVYDWSPDDFDLSSKTLRRKLGAETVAYLSRMQNEVQQERAAQGFSNEYTAEFKYTLGSSRNPNNADILTTPGKTDGVEVMYIHVPKDPAKTHPHKTVKCAQEITKRLNGRYMTNAHDVISICDAHRIRVRPEFYYKSAIENSSPQYSPEFVEWVVGQFERDGNFFAKARADYRAAMSAKAR